MIRHEENILIGNNIRFYRKKIGINQHTLAKRMYMSRSYIIRIELGYHNLNLKQIFAFAKCLNVHYSCLLDGVVPIECDLYVKIRKLNDFDYRLLNKIVDRINQQN